MKMTCRLTHGRGQVGGKDKSCAAMASQQFRQPFFIDGYSAGLQLDHLGRIIIHTNDRMTDFGKTNSGNQSDIARTDDSDLQRSVRLS